MADNDAWKILGIILIIGTILIFVREVLVPFFKFTSVLLFVCLILFLFVEGLREKAHIVGVMFLISISLWGILYIIGFGLGDSTVGQAVLEIHGTITSAEQEVFNSLDLSIKSLVDESCKTLDESYCNSLKFAALSGKSFIEIENIVNNIKTTSKVVKKT